MKSAWPAGRESFPTQSFWLLFFGLAAPETVCQLAGRILSLPDFEGLPGLCRIPMERLMELKGVGRVKAVQLKCLAELAGRMAKASAGERLCFDTPATIADYFMEELRHKEQEHLIALFLNTKNKLLREKLMFKGTVNASIISPREIFWRRWRFMPCS